MATFFRAAVLRVLAFFVNLFTKIVFNINECTLYKVFSTEIKDYFCSEIKFFWSLILFFSELSTTKCIVNLVSLKMKKYL